MTVALAPAAGRVVTEADVRAVVHARRSVRSRSITVSVGLAIAVFVVFCVGISVGDFPIPLRDVVPAIFGHGSADSEFIIRSLRLPRALTGLLVGSAFGLSGSIFQSLARNPLASPDVIGITTGASAAAVFIIVIVGTTGLIVSVGAFGGALIAALATYFLAYRQGVSPYRLVLVGIGVGEVLSSAIAYLLTRSQLYQAQQATVWLTGSLNARGWEHVRPVAVALLVLVPLTLLLVRPLRAIQLGDDAAKGIGVGVERAKLGLLVVGVGLAAVATASAGPIEFVAFVSPPIARRLTRASGLTMVPAALVGALVVLAADLVGRRLFAPTELPVGVITGVIGGPYLLWLLARSNKVGRGG